MIGFLRSGRRGRLQDLLSAYVDGQVSEGEAARVEEHLSGCDDCRRELDTLRMTVGLLHRLPEIATSRSFALTEAPEPIGRGWSVAWTTRAATSMAALLVAALLLADAFGIVAQRGLEAEQALPPEAPSIAAEAVTVTQAVPVEAVAVQEIAVQEVAAEKQVQVERIVREAEPPIAAMAAPAADAAPSPQPAPAPAAPVAVAAAPPPEDVAQPGGRMAPVPKAAAEMPQAEAARESPVPAVPEEGAALATPGLTLEAQAPLPAVIEPPSEADQSPDTREPDADEGVALPLWQLEVGAGALFLVLVLGTLWTARRARRPWG